MASNFNVCASAIAVLLFWTLAGWPLTRRLLPANLALPFAPVAGWAMQSVVAVPIFYLLPFSRLNVALVALVLAAVSWSAPLFDEAWEDRARARQGGRAEAIRSSETDPRAAPLASVSPWGWLGALGIAAAIAAAILPKQLGDAVFLSNQIFDHAKIAIVDDIARLGVPPGNPFIANDGSGGKLAYYYLWHFSAAEVALLFGVTGWEADAAMTFLSAFTSLAAMMGLAVSCGGKRAASVWVVVIAATCSSRVIFETLFGLQTMEDWVPAPGGLGGWMFQSVWVPQHLIATSCVLMSVLLLSQPFSRRQPLLVVMLGLSIAAAFESSTWIGGIVFALASIVIVPMRVMRAERSRRLSLLGSLGAVLVLTLLFAWPFLSAQIAASAHRLSASPIAVMPFAVLGDHVPAALRTFLDIPAFWLILLPIELPGMYLAGLFVMKNMTSGTDERSNAGVVGALTAVALTALLVSCLLASTLADNNDLAWRATLLASSVLIIFAAIGMASWIADRKWLAAGLGLFAIALGLPDCVREIHGNFVGDFQPEGRVFARAPAMWASVRKHLGVAERVASNPSAMASLTPWPVNISWSLLANRRSCYAGWELTQVYSSVPHKDLWQIDNQFRNVFDGKGSDLDIKAMATQFDCAVVLVTSEDGAWTNDPFRSSAYYRLVDEAPGQWRIYRR